MSYDGQPTTLAQPYNLDENEFIATLEPRDVDQIAVERWIGVTRFESEDLARDPDYWQRAFRYDPMFSFVGKGGWQTFSRMEATTPGLFKNGVRVDDGSLWWAGMPGTDRRPEPNDISKKEKCVNMGVAKKNVEKRRQQKSWKLAGP